MYLILIIYILNKNKIIFNIIKLELFTNYENNNIVYILKFGTSFKFILVQINLVNP